MVFDPNLNKNSSQWLLVRNKALVLRPVQSRRFLSYEHFLHLGPLLLFEKKFTKTQLTSLGLFESKREKNTFWSVLN